MSRRGWIAMGIGITVAIVVALTSDGAGPDRQAMATPQFGSAFEIDLYGPFVDEGTIARAWAVDPYGLLGDALEDRDRRDVEVVRNIGGYDAVLVYGVFPNCQWAPEVRAEWRGDRLGIDLRSHGGCNSDLIRTTRAVAVEFADEAEPSEVQGTHRDP